MCEEVLSVVPCDPGILIFHRPTAKGMPSCWCSSAKKNRGMQGGNSRTKGEESNPGDLLHTWDSTTQLHGDFYKLLQ